MDLRRFGHIFCGVLLLSSLAAGVRAQSGDDGAEVIHLFPGGRKRAAPDAPILEEIQSKLTSLQSDVVARAIGQLERSGKTPEGRTRELLDAALERATPLAHSQRENTFSVDSPWLERAYPEIVKAKRAPERLHRFIAEHADRPAVINLVLRQIEVGHIDVPEKVRPWVMSSIAKVLRDPPTRLKDQGGQLLQAIKTADRLESGGSAEWRDMLIDLLVRTGDSVSHFDITHEAMPLLKSMHERSAIPDARLTEAYRDLKPYQRIELMEAFSSTKAGQELLVKWIETQPLDESATSATNVTRIWKAIIEGGALNSDPKLKERALKVLSDRKGENSHFVALLNADVSQAVSIGLRVRSADLPLIMRVLSDWSASSERLSPHEEAGMRSLLREPILEALERSLKTRGVKAEVADSGLRAVELLGLMDDPEILEKVTRWTAPQSSDGHRIRAARILGSANPGDASTQLALLRALEGRPSKELIITALEGVAGLDRLTPEAMAVLDGKLEEPRLADAMRQSSMRVQLKIRTALMAFRTGGGSPCGSGSPLRNWLAGRKGDGAP